MKLMPTTRRFNGQFLPCFVVRHGNCSSIRLISLRGFTKGEAERVARQVVKDMRSHEA